MQSSKDFIRRTTLIHMVLLLCQIIFLATAYWEIAPERDDDYDREFQMAVALAFLVSFIGSYYLFIKKTRKSCKYRGIREKLITYKSGLYIQWIILTLFSVFSTFSYIMTGDFLFIFTSVFSIVVFIINRPSINRTCSDLDLDKDEQRVLKTPDAAI